MCKVFRVMRNTPESIRVFCESQTTRTCARAEVNTTMLTQAAPHVVESLCKEPGMAVRKKEQGCSGHSYGIMECNKGNSHLSEDYVPPIDRRYEGS